MTKDELRRIWRLRVMDTNPDKYLWSDEEFSDYLNEAEYEAARRTHVLVDSTSYATQSMVTADNLSVSLDPTILFIRRAWLESNSRQILRRCDTRTMDTRNPGWETQASGKPQIYIPDWEAGKLALWPPPSTDDILRMTVVRLPLYEIANDDDTPEVPSRMHRALLEWVSYRAYSKQDADGEDAKRADLALARFEQEFGPRVTSANEQFSLENYGGEGDYQ